MKNSTYNFEKKQSVFGLLKMIISIYKVFDAGMIIISIGLSVLFDETWINTLKNEQVFTIIMAFIMFVVRFFIILFVLSWIVRGIIYGCAKIKSFLKMRYLPLSSEEIKETLGENAQYFDYAAFIKKFLKVKLFYCNSSVISTFTFLDGGSKKYCIIKIPSELLEQIAERAVSYFNCTKREFKFAYKDDFTDDDTSINKFDFVTIEDIYVGEKI